MPAALARSPSASPKAAQKGQLTRGRRGERGEKEEEEGEKEERWERDAAPRRQDLGGGGGGGDVNEGHCARMETSNGKPKPPLPFLQSRRRFRRRLPFSLPHCLLPS